MTQNGIAVASLNYRFTDETRFPGQLTDCEKAIDFLNKEAETRGFQFGPVTACGLSAGGQLSLMLAGTGSVDNAIAFGAPVDLTPEEAREGYRETLERLVGAPLELEKLKAASPIHNLAGSSARYILIHGTEDRTIPYQQAIQMTKPWPKKALVWSSFWCLAAATPWLEAPGSGIGSSPCWSASCNESVNILGIC